MKKIYIILFIFLLHLDNQKKIDVNHKSSVRNASMTLAGLLTIPSILPVGLYIAYVDCSFIEGYYLWLGIAFVFWYFLNWLLFIHKKIHVSYSKILDSFPGKAKSILIFIVLLILLIGFAGIGAELGHRNCFNN